VKSSRNLAWSQLKLGLILIASLFLLAVGILRLGSNSGLFARSYTLYLHLENTFGLKIGSTVRLAGIQVGNVEDISFSTDPANPKVVIRMDISRKYEDRIRDDSTVSIRSLGLLGDKYVDISVGSPKASVMKDGDSFKNMPTPEFSNVLNKASTGIESLNTVIDQLRVVMADVSQGQGTLGLMLKDPKLYHDMDRAIKNIDRVAAKLQNPKSSFGKLVNEPELYDNLLEVSDKARQVADKLNKGSLAMLSEDPQFYKNLRDISDNLNLVSESAKQLVTNLETGSLAKLSRDDKLYSDIKGISGKLDKMMDKIDSSQGSAGKLINDPELYDNMNTFFKDADALVVDIKSNPDKYVNISLF
jgi:phospholipid/cholesterol/gamma-HCH transport system substrate-binding protein